MVPTVKLPKIALINLIIVWRCTKMQAAWNKTNTHYSYIMVVIIFSTYWLRIILIDAVIGTFVVPVSFCLYYISAEVLAGQLENPPHSFSQIAHNEPSANYWVTKVRGIIDVWRTVLGTMESSGQSSTCESPCVVAGWAVPSPRVCTHLSPTMSSQQVGVVPVRIRRSL